MPVGIIGYTGTGKSRMIREVILPMWWKKRVSALILDPVGQSWGRGMPWVWQTRDPVAWLQAAKRSRNCVLIMDECLLHIGSGTAIAKELYWAPCTSRNNGDFLYMLGQRTKHMPPSARSQCSEFFLFWQPDIEEAKEAAVSAGMPSSFGKDIFNLPLGQCYHCRPKMPPRLNKVF